MTITNEPVIAGQPVKFKLSGFPEESAVRSSIERFYALKAEADKNFLIFNAFDEQIFSGKVGENGKIESLEITPRSGKAFESKPQ
jgi:hypothetical protein